VVVESKPSEMLIVRKKDKQAQMMVPDLAPPISAENIQLTLKQKINTNGTSITGCSLLPDGRIVLYYFNAGAVSFYIDIPLTAIP
jgi:hypothetical protein